MALEIYLYNEWEGQYLHWILVSVHYIVGFGLQLIELELNKVDVIRLSITFQALFTRSFLSHKCRYLQNITYQINVVLNVKMWNVKIKCFSDTVTVICSCRRDFIIEDLVEPLEKHSERNPHPQPPVNASAFKYLLNSVLN